MTLGALLIPITAATILNVFLFAGAWKAGQVERRTGVVPWYMIVGSTLYGVPLLAFLYWSRTRPLLTGWDIFGAALAAQIMGGAIVYLILQEVTAARSQTWKERAPMLGICALLIFVVVTLAI